MHAAMELQLIGLWILSCLVVKGHTNTPIIATLASEVGGVEKVYSQPGTMGFRILRRESDSVLIGGREMLLTINHNNPKDLQMHVEEFKTCDNGNAFIQCSARTTFKRDRDCFNFIRIAEVMSNNMLLVCGTNALNPRCYTCNVTRHNTGIQEVSCPGPRGEGHCEFSTKQGYGTVDGSGIAPKHWELNATARYTDGQLFLGVSQTYGKSESSISRVDVYPGGANPADTSFTNRIETTSYFSRSVNKADFVGEPLVVGDRVYYFYRELAVEHENQGNMIYSRVARVCKDDTGMNYYWSSFQKARLSCSVGSNAMQYDYNEIQDLFVEERGSDHYIHAVISGNPNGPQSSAVCVYRLSDIDQVFDQSSFKGPRSPDRIWLPIARSNVPNPRPGLNCNNPAQDLSFIRQFPLMHKLAPSYNEYKASPRNSRPDVPLFEVDGTRFSSIVVDNTTDGNIYYIGTEGGSILKAYHQSDEFKVYELKVTADNQPIVDLQLIGGSTNRHLIAVSDNTVYRIPLHNCATRCERRCSELMYGYCRWEGGCCKDVGQTSCAENPSDMYVKLHPAQPLTVCENEKVQLYCDAHAAPFCPPITMDWTMNGGQPTNDMGHLISIDHLADDPANQLSALSVQSAIATNSTSMECRVEMKIAGETMTIEESTTIRIKNCITQGSLAKRFHLHQKLQQENLQSKSCDTQVFDCAYCGSFP